MAGSPGRLVLVVGPSGVGKDTLINGAHAALADDGRFVFVRRIVTRPADAALEDHHSLSEAMFEQLRAEGKLALSWQAHGLRYGLPASVVSDIADGKIVVANGSRQALGFARQIFPDCAVVVITADETLRAQRLLQRGREDGAQIAERLARETAAVSAALDPTVIDNSSTPEIGVAALTTTLRQLAVMLTSA